MLSALTIAALLGALPVGNAQLEHGGAGVKLRLSSFETERVAVAKRGTFTSAELLYRTASGDRFDLRVLYRGPGELPAKSVTSVVVQTAKGGVSRWTSAKKTGCRVKLYKATEAELAGKVDCRAPEDGAPFEAVFDAKR